MKPIMTVRFYAGPSIVPAVDTGPGLHQAVAPRVHRQQ